MFFWKKSKEEKLAEEGDKGAILALIDKGKKEKAIEVLEKFKENKELRGLLFKLYMEEGKYYYAYQLIEHYDPDLASAKEKALIYEKVGELERSAKEYAKLGDWESLKKAGILLWQAKRPQEALELLNRSLSLAPALKRQEVEEVINKIKEELGILPKEGLLERLRKGRREDHKVPKGHNRHFKSPRWHLWYLYKLFWNHALLLSDKLFYKGLGIKGLEVLYAFTHTYKLYRNAKLLTYRHYRTTLCRPIQLCKHHPAYIHRFFEDFCLLYGILSYGGVKHQKCFCRFFGKELFDHIPYLSKFPYEWLFGMKPSRCVYEDNIIAFILCLLHGFIHNRSWVCTLMLFYYMGSAPLGPNFQLLYSRRPKGIPRHKKHLFALFYKPVGQFSYGGSLARAVYSQKEIYTLALMGLF